jgi:O-methyltransferase involved in polyketide biosynthesis
MMISMLGRDADSVGAAVVKGGHAVATASVIRTRISDDFIFEFYEQGSAQAVEVFIGLRLKVRGL